MEDNKRNIEKKRVYYALFFPILISLLVLLVFLFEKSMGVSLSKAGIYPRKWSSLIHILTMPFIHSGWSHLFNNLLSFFILSSALFYFYKEFAAKVLFYSFLLSGFILWIIGRESYHIGLSGVVYALSFFLAFSGLIRRHIPLIALSLVVVFLYGNGVWHMFPWQEFDRVSWEGHLGGAISGVLFAIVYRKRGPQRPVVEWDDDEDEDDFDSLDDDEKPYWVVDSTASSKPTKTDE